MKNAVKYVLQSVLGFRTYLYVFALFKVWTLRWDRKENAFLHFLSLVPDHGTVLDIGANLGVMSVLTARRLPNVQVLAFEPMPQNSEVFKRVVKYFSCSNVRLFELALGSEEGMLQMVMPVQGNVRMQGLSHVVHKSIPDNNEGEKFTVPVKTLDQLEEVRSNKITAIKMDVENFESFVLEGAKELLKRDHPLIYIELWENENRHRCFELVRQLDYSIRVQEGDSLVDYDPVRHTTQNFFFV